MVVRIQLLSAEGKNIVQRVEEAEEKKEYREQKNFLKCNSCAK
jgi:hypothetical protein